MLDHRVFILFERVTRAPDLWRSRVARRWEVRGAAKGNDPDSSAPTGPTFVAIAGPVGIRDVSPPDVPDLGPATWGCHVDVPKLEGSTYESRIARALELAATEFLRGHPGARLQ